MNIGVGREGVKKTTHRMHTDAPRSVHGTDYTHFLAAFAAVTPLSPFLLRGRLFLGRTDEEDIALQTATGAVLIIELAAEHGLDGCTRLLLAGPHGNHDTVSLWRGLHERGAGHDES